MSREDAMGKKQKKKRQNNKIQDRDRIEAGQGRLIKGGAKTLERQRASRSQARMPANKPHQNTNWQEIV